jgi:hypothetical protein
MDGLTGFTSLLFVTVLGIFWWISKKPQFTRFGSFRFSTRNKIKEVSGHSIVLCARLPLTPQHQLHLIETMEALVLVCTHPHGSSVVLTKQTGLDKAA